MMIKYFSVVISLFLLTAFVLPPVKNKKLRLSIEYDPNSVVSGGDTIAYTGKQPDLTWADFRGVLPKDAVGVANSALGFRFNARITVNDEEVLLTIKTAAYFVRNHSWSDAQRRDDHILRHEQLHFELARVGAEIFRKKILAAKMNDKNFGDQLNQAYREAWKEYIALQEQYDEETNHSINKTQQAAWDKKITEAVAKIK
jgi:hypothetical protein